MKKKITSVLCAAMLMLALPTLAWAAPSPYNSGTVNSTDGTQTSVNVSCKGGEVKVTPEQAGTTASNYKEGAVKDALVTTFEITAVGNADVSDLNVTVSVGKQYANMIARVYIQHGNDINNATSTDYKEVKVAADGTVSFTMDGLSWVTIAIAEGQTPAGTATGSATTGSAASADKAPQTGVDFTGTAGAAIVMTAAAGCVAVALRKKVTE
ncbi:NPXTG-anchored protein [Adlercreutzia sp. ZJ473]|uniref:NPXTG-anchored protein n=1 Tax=Adlercreutzia sp. ZJ473 TaxID=2722822 RepID=UPI001556A472|nr:NPXTG-anchored protein [Adlercreutzia sp. ZJ473]